MKILDFKLSVSALVASCLLASAGSLWAQSAFLSEEDLYDEEVSAGPVASDPLEAINRITFGLNDYVYAYVLGPVADGYTYITPDPVEKGAKNFFNNLSYPVRLVGNLLQGRLQGAWVETGRFAINTTVGIAGIFTPADTVGGFEPIAKEDVGQALGAWGVGEGPYLVLPLLGPSNLRDLGGLIGDAAAHPTSEPFSLIDSWDWEWKTALTVTEIVVESPTIIERYNQLKGSSIDPYGSMKNGYTQLRRAAIAE
jgi:phospholipid-binding lipoprotein MlaA